MNRYVLLAALALVVAACGGNGDGDTTTSAAAVATTTTAAETTTTAAPEETTTTEGETPTTEAPVSGAQFALTEVVFGGEGYVAITNVGSEAGNLQGWQLCQRPSYFGISSQELAPGETLFVTARPVADLDVEGTVISADGRFGALDAGGGEIGLYSSGNFASTEAIVSYVEWGRAGHGRTGVAVGAGIWGDGDFVDATGATLIRTTAAPPLGAADWETG